MALEQEGFRWRNDDGSETTATWKDSQDTNISLALDTPVRLRFAIDVNTGPSGAAKYRLEYKKSTDSQWIGIMPSGTSGHAVTLALSSNITASGEVTTAQLTAPSGKTTGDFATGRMWDDENGVDETADIPATDYTEFEWCVQAVSGVASASDIYQFRVTREVSAITGPTLLYSEDFSTTTTLEGWSSFDADWVKDSVASDEIYVYNSTQRAVGLVGGTVRSYWTNASLTTEQSIHADIILGSGTNNYSGLMVRMSGSGEGYIAEWDTDAGTIILSRVTADWGTFTQLGPSFGTVSPSTTYTGAFLKATGTGATVTLTFGDDTNGTATPFEDTDAGRFTSGYVGLNSYIDSGGSLGDVSFDNLEIYDES